ncbi:MAG: hypothetical protein K0Q87_3760 [Neobacillus sp.]|jgi:membrane-bound inhibitor of C-type lysozyme|nr:hypothetical protein [Neobacillus sp.]MDF2857909.1 hypothetical protein [Neobacillus sp.]
MNWWYPQANYYPSPTGELRQSNENYELQRQIARLERHLAEIQEALSYCMRKNVALKKDLKVVREQSSVQAEKDQAYQQSTLDKIKVKCVAITETTVTFEISGRTLTFNEDISGKYVGEYTPGKVYEAMADYAAGSVYITIKDDNEIWHVFRYSSIQY